MTRVERGLRSATAPNELDAQSRAWEVARSVYAQRPTPARRRALPRLVLVPVALVLAAVLALTPAGAAVHRFIEQTLGVKHPRPALFSLPSPGRLLVAGRGGVWTIGSDGTRRRLGTGDDAAWSPRALYVAIATRNGLAVVDPRGVPQWSIGRPDIRDPRWYPPTGYRLAYLSGSNLRVIAGDGTGDRRLAAAVSAIAPAWRPDHAYQLAYATRDGRVLVRDTDTGTIAFSRRPRSAVTLLQWSADGRRLLVLTSDAALVYDASGTLLARVPGSPRTAALSPSGAEVALLSRSGALGLSDLHGHTRQLFTGAGLRQLAFSPDGRWLLIAWPDADQWVFLRASGRPRIVAVSRIAQQFGAFPRIEGWCCSAGGG